MANPRMDGLAEIDAKLRSCKEGQQMATYVVTNNVTDDRNGKKSKTRPPAEKAYAEEIAKGNFVRLIRIDFIGYGKGGAPKEIKRHEGKMRKG